MTTAKFLGMNKYQKRIFKRGEERISGDEIWRYVELSQSDDAADRLDAAEHLCPCHVRRRIDEVWEALFRMMEDPDAGVRRAAYHTLEDGCKPDDPKLQAIFERAWQTETDRQVLGFLKKFDGGRAKRERVEMKAAQISKYADRGKCDFCDDTNVSVRTDYDTEIPNGGSRRLALVCEACDS